MLADYKTQNIIDYFNSTGPEVKLDIIDTFDTNNTQLPSVFMIYYSKTSIYDRGRIDNTHYVTIIQNGSNSTSRFVGFINGLHFNKLILE